MAIDEAAELLKTTPEALAAFEESYRIADIQEEAESGNFFDMNSRKAAAKKQEQRERSADDQTAIAKQTADALASRIGDELLAIGDLGCLPKGDAQEEATAPLVSREEIESLPKELRPDLRGTLYKKEITADAYPTILFYLKRALGTTSPKEYSAWMNHFLQGLDVLDLDPITYEILGCNRNSIGHWFPPLKTAVDKHPFFKVPETKK